MKPQFVYRTTFLLAASAFIHAAHAKDEVKALAIKEHTARIERVEQGLLPNFVTQDTKPMLLADRMKHYNVPGISVAVIDGGKVVWAKAYGVRDLDSREPVTESTVFQAASISKPVSAMAALRLVEQNKLSLDGNVNDTLMSWKVPDNEFTNDKKVTLRGLVTHRAGLTVSGFAGYSANMPVPTVPQVLQGTQPANSKAVLVDVPPGTMTRYSGGGFTVMQQMMTDVTGKPFQEQLQTQVLDAIGMKNSTFAQPLSGPLKAQAANAHTGGKVLIGKANTYPELAAAGLWTTPSDLATFAIELQQAHAGKSSRVISQAMAKHMLTKDGDFGLGILVMGKVPNLRFAHSGSNAGFESHLVADIKDAGKGAVVMANTNGASALIHEVIRAIANEYGWKGYVPPRRNVVKVAPEILSTLTGYYETDAKTDVKVWVRQRGDDLLVRSNRSQAWMRLVAASDTKFFMVEEDVGIEFKKGSDGKIIQLNVIEGISTIPVKRGMETPPKYSDEPIFLRGSMNEWGIKHRLEARGKDAFAVNIPFEPGNYEFKIGSADFQKVDLGSPTKGVVIQAGDGSSTQPLERVGENFVLKVTRAGSYTFTLNIENALLPKVMVTAAP
jgi:CubicO group peptidase (beta-lactamase class C family)